MLKTAASLYSVTDGDAIGQWVADRACGGYYDPDTSASIGLLRGERIVAGAVFNNWNRASVQVHMAIERMNRTFLAALAHYAFIQLGANVVIAPVSSKNYKSQRALDTAGFWLDAEIRDAHPDGHLQIYTLTGDRCKFLNKPFLSRLESCYGR